MRFLLRRLAMAAVMAGALATPVAAQDFRGSIVGTVTDATGGVLPGVTVTITNSETGITQTVVTDAKGLYHGALSQRRHLFGDGAALRIQESRASGMEVTVGEPTRVDLSLEPGVMSETVQVTAETPLLNTTTGISGTTVNAKQIAQLPLGDGTAYMLTRLAPGIVDSSDLHFARPMDNGNLGGIVAERRRRAATSSRSTARRTCRTRAASGSRRRRTRSRSSRCRPTPSTRRPATRRARRQPRAQERHERVPLADRLLQPRRQPHGDAAADRAGRRHEADAHVQPLHRHGRRADRQEQTFFMASFEHLRDVQPEPSTYTVPTEKMRAGDFSEFSTLIYDPATATGRRRAHRLRQQHDSDPSRINPVAAAYAALYPLPNRPGTNGNYFTNGLRPVRLQRVHGPRRSQLHVGQPDVRERRTTTSARKIATTGRRTRRTRPTAADQRLPGDAGLRLPHRTPA